MHYVAGFLFDDAGENVALIEKQRPAWQKGRFNAIGGAVERSDRSAATAMKREFEEETGVIFDEWKKFCTLITTTGDKVDFFHGYSPLISQVSTKTDETVAILPVKELSDRVMPNLRWLIQAALSIEKHCESSSSFTVLEND